MGGVDDYLEAYDRQADDRRYAKPPVPKTRKHGEADKAVCE